MNRVVKDLTPPRKSKKLVGSTRLAILENRVGVRYRT